MLIPGRSDSSQCDGTELHSPAAHSHHSDPSWAGQPRTPPTTPHGHTAALGGLRRETGGGLPQINGGDLSPWPDSGRYLHCRHTNSWVHKIDIIICSSISSAQLDAYPLLNFHAGVFVSFSKPLFPLSSLPLVPQPSS